MIRNLSILLASVLFCLICSEALAQKNSYDFSFVYDIMERHMRSYQNAVDQILKNCQRKSDEALNSNNRQLWVLNFSGQDIAYFKNVSDLNAVKNNFKGALEKFVSGCMQDIIREAERQSGSKAPASINSQISSIRKMVEQKINPELRQRQIINPNYKEPEYTSSQLSGGANFHKDKDIGEVSEARASSNNYMSHRDEILGIYKDAKNPLEGVYWGPPRKEKEKGPDVSLPIQNMNKIPQATSNRLKSLFAEDKLEVTVKKEDIKLNNNSSDNQNVSPFEKFESIENTGTKVESLALSDAERKRMDDLEEYLKTTASNPYSEELLAVKEESIELHLRDLISKVEQGRSNKSKKESVTDKSFRLKDNAVSSLGQDWSSSDMSSINISPKDDSNQNNIRINNNSPTSYINADIVKSCFIDPYNWGDNLRKKHSSIKKLIEEKTIEYYKLEFEKRMQSLEKEDIDFQYYSYKTFAEMAALAGNSYTTPKIENTNGWEITSDENCVIIEEMNKNWSGFKCELYKKGDLYVLSFSGTDGLWDWGSNIVDAAIPVGQTKRAFETVRRLLDEGIVTKDNLVITGHSLGGRLAAECSIKYGIPSYIYNSAGTSIETKKKMKDNVEMRRNADKIISIHSLDDMLTRTQDNNLPSAAISAVAAPFVILGGVSSNGGITFADIKATGARLVIGEAYGEKGGHGIGNLYNALNEKTNMLDQLRTNSK